MHGTLGAKKTLESLELDNSIQECTQDALAELGQKELRNLSMTCDINYPYMQEDFPAIDKG